MKDIAILICQCLWKISINRRVSSVAAATATTAATCATASYASAIISSWLKSENEKEKKNLICYRIGKKSEQFVSNQQIIDYVDYQWISWWRRKFPGRESIESNEGRRKKGCHLIWMMLSLILGSINIIANKHYGEDGNYQGESP